MLDQGRIEEKLDDLVRYHGELVEDLPSKSEFVDGRLVRRGIEKTIELIADTIIDIALLIISGKGLEKPEDSRDAIALLEKVKILPKDVAARIMDLISFRNLLVHRYTKIDENLEFSTIKEEHPDIISFVKEIEKFLTK